MKYFLILLLSFSAYAENFVSPRIVELQLPQAYQLKADCEKLEGEDCVDLDIAKLPTKVMETFNVQVNDESKPIYEQASNVKPCKDAEECRALVAQENFCPSTHMALFRTDGEVREAYCTRLIAYQQKEVRRIRISEAKKSLHEAQLLIDAQRAAYVSADAQANRAMECGKSAQRLLLIRNAPKKLSSKQVKELVSTYSPVKALLDTGSLVSAQEEIEKVVADGVIVTDADKAALIAHINGCK